ncbi:hypothetical protein TVAG_011580 [Trichomonas vaginalis G3]|uniref:Uncharacterized protein n=1 Tax=Trichomonas vaginalis (strain ATCC PRA-98 / G3) TaxID=412133 RepID=A2GGL7_TRIV3|nr:hypothetical protein TVAG_011580 [Trichomonas vaginalis G3]|eukprot:XP_001296630.1 hypothetical protein [Trichomonas vaginalis G3]
MQNDEMICQQTCEPIQDDYETGEELEEEEIFEEEEDLENEGEKEKEKSKTFHEKYIDQGEKNIAHICTHFDTFSDKHHSNLKKNL